MNNVQVFIGKRMIFFQLVSLRARLKLEIRGMTCHGPSAYTVLKKHFGFSGSRPKVLEQLEQKIQKIKEKEV